MVEETAIDDEHLQGNGEYFQLVQSSVVERLQLDLVHQWSKQKYFNAQRLHTWTDGTEESEQEDENSLPQQHYNLPVVVLVFVALRQEAQTQFKARIEVIVDFGIWMELVVSKLLSLPSDQI